MLSNVLSSNAARGRGGGLHVHTAFRLSIRNQTFRSNTAEDGAAVFMNDRPACSRKDEAVYKQTLPYRAPEVALGDHHFSEVVDEWSVGVILYEILLGTSLFDASSEIALINSMFRFAGSAAMEAIFGNDSARFLRRYSKGELI